MSLHSSSFSHLVKRKVIIFYVLDLLQIQKYFNKSGAGIFCHFVTNVDTFFECISNMDQN